MKGTDNWKPILDSIRDKEVAEESFTKETVKSGSDLSASKAVLCKKDVEAVLRRHTAMKSSQDVFFRTQNG